MLNQPTNLKIDGEISVGKIYEAIERYVSSTVVAFTIIFS